MQVARKKAFHSLWCKSYANDARENMKWSHSRSITLSSVYPNWGLRTERGYAKSSNLKKTHLWCKFAACSSPWRRVNQAKYVVFWSFTCRFGSVQPFLGGFSEPPKNMQQFLPAQRCLPNFCYGFTTFLLPYSRVPCHAHFLFLICQQPKRGAWQ